MLAKDGLVELGQSVVPLADTPVVEHGRLAALHELLEQRVLPLRRQGKRNQPTKSTGGSAAKLSKLAAAYLADGLGAGARYAPLLALALLAEHVELAARPDGLERVAPLLRRRAASLHGHLGRAVLALLLSFALLLLARRRRRHGLRLRHGRDRRGLERGPATARV